MSEYTREEILKLIEENGGPEGLDLSGKDLSGIDLSREAIAAELERAREKAPDETPVWYSDFVGGINLERANFKGAILTGANLKGATLAEVNLKEANLVEADLPGADLGWASLQEANLSLANLQGAFLAYTDLQGAFLIGANLKWATLLGANLQRAMMEGAILKGADLTDANLKEVSLKIANLQRAKLSNSHLEKVDLFPAKSLEGAHFYNAFLDDTRLKREQLGEAIGEELEGRYDEAKEAYLALKNNFAEIGRYEDASWAYRKERRMEKLAALRKAKDAWQEHDWKGAIPRYAKVAGDQLVERLCDYGEGLGRVAGSLIAVWVAFALIYGLIAGVWGPWQATGSGKIRYITRNPIDLLAFSLGAMTTLEPVGLEARRILAMRILMPLEALLGIFFTGLLGFVAGKRIRRS